MKKAISRSKPCFNAEHHYAVLQMTLEIVIDFVTNENSGTCKDNERAKALKAMRNTGGQEQ
ncbi:MAG: hypothetical protein GY749_37785 [Desulfobacteraceae bacterium]|nr:hypothetical protein [Desulfobacteraceae bacterium]